MRRLLLTLAVVAAACSSQTATTQTQQVTIPTVSSTTSTSLDLPMEVQGCDAPPVTFSTLCETIELLDEWYVDGPVDVAVLAEIASTAAQEFESTDTEEPPRTFFCAIPDTAFTALCDVLKQRIQDERIPVGPAVEAAVTAMIDRGLDPFTWYINPEAAAGFRSDGVVAGVGILLDATDAAGSKCTEIAEVCQLRIVFVLDNNPGAAAGLMPGDIVTAVDGKSVIGQGFVETATQISGDETGDVVLSLERDGTPVDVTVQRAELEFPSAEVELPVDGVGYLRIPDFSFDIPFIVDSAVGALMAAGPRTIVIDLRDNPGGLIDAVINVASQFIADGPILHTQSPDGEFTYSAEGGAPVTSQRLLVLVNEGTASAAEILAGALRDRRGAVIIGQPTFGKNAVQIPFELRNGGEFHVAIAHWTTPNGSSVVDGGLIPDRVVELPTDASPEDLVNFALQNS